MVWKGQFESKEGNLTIGLEAVADYQLWIWRSSFRFPGALDDINTWDRLPLFEAMYDSEHDKIDF
jgi:hypothetical protein